MSKSKNTGEASLDRRELLLGVGVTPLFMTSAFGIFQLSQPSSYVGIVSESSVQLISESSVDIIEE
jgi:hypothetical protein